MHPQTPFAHIVAAIEIFIGLMSLTLITGMMFARFPKPTARFVFARNAVVRALRDLDAENARDGSGNPPNGSERLLELQVVHAG